MAHSQNLTTSGSHKFIGRLMLVLFLLLAAGQAFAENGAEENVAEAAGDEPDVADVAVKTSNFALLQSGYRFVSPDGPLAAAAPYGRLKSGMTGGLSAGTLGKDIKLTVDGIFLHEDDYQAEMEFDYNGLLRFNLASAALWHNLLREPVNPGVLGLKELDSGQLYGVGSTTTQVNTRIKMGNNPFHLNLGYWELKREGFHQMRFSDHYFGSGASSVITDAGRVDSITRQGSLGLDAHVGPVDFTYGFRIRDFSNQAPDPRYTYANNAGGFLIPGSQAHDVIPDSRVTSHTFKLFSDMSGGLVGSAAYTLTQRENRGGHGEALPSERPSDVIHLAAGDISYTPSRLYSFALKYRHQEIDRSTPASLYYPFAATPLVMVRPASSTVRDTVIASAIFRPSSKLIYRLEYSAERESRDNIRDAQSPLDSTVALHADSRLTHTGKASLYWRPLNGLKLNASYSYAACDNPAYGASFGDRHTGKLLLTYASIGKWGVTGSYLVQHASGESSAWVLPPSNIVISTGSAASSHALPRVSRNNAANASVWFSPLERLTITTSYSYLHSDIDQTSLLTNLSQNALVATNYRSSAHVYGIDAVYAASDQLDFSLAFQQVFSRSVYDVPPISPFSSSDSFGTITTYSSAGISDLTRLDSTETGLSARADWRITALLGCSLDYGFRLYDSGNPVYDGSVHTTLLSLKARW